MTPSADTLLPPHAAIPPDITSLLDYERHAPRHIPASTLHHIASGAGLNLTVAENRRAFERMHFKPRLLADLGKASTQITLFGRPHATPILLAPIAYHRLVHPAGECDTARAAAAMQIGIAVSTLASQSLEDIANASRNASSELGQQPAPLWFQLYFQRYREHSLQLIERAQNAGYEALVVTVDAVVKRGGFPLPAGVQAVNIKGFPGHEYTTQNLTGPILFGTPLVSEAPTWKDVAWVRENCQLPLIVKGIMSAEDARIAIDHGADALVVSNHGGRVLDGLPASIDALPAIANAVAGRVPLILDSGVRTGTDIVKALAFGACAVMIGRPQMYALAVAGLLGVAHMLHLLKAELELAMAQLGCASVAQISSDILWNKS